MKMVIPTLFGLEGVVADDLKWEKFKEVKLSEGGRLCDIAPTLLDMMDIEIPKEMTGNSLIIK